MTDGQGGHPYTDSRGRPRVTRPGRHYQQIVDMRRGVDDRLRTWQDNCRDDDGNPRNPPPCVTDPLRQPIQQPVFPPVPPPLNHLLEMVAIVLIILDIASRLFPVRWVIPIP